MWIHFFFSGPRMPSLANKSPDSYWRGRVQPCASPGEPSLFPSVQPCGGARCQPSLPTGLHELPHGGVTPVLSRFARNCFYFSTLQFLLSSHKLSPTTQTYQGPLKALWLSVSPPTVRLKERRKNQLHYAVSPKVLRVWPQFVNNSGWMLLMMGSIYRKHHSPQNVFFGNEIWQHSGQSTPPKLNRNSHKTVGRLTLYYIRFKLWIWAENITCFRSSNRHWRATTWCSWPRFSCNL